MKMGKKTLTTKRRRSGSESDDASVNSNDTDEIIRCANVHRPGITASSSEPKREKLPRFKVNEGEQAKVSPSASRSKDCSSDEDIFDLIASGRSYLLPDQISSNVRPMKKASEESSSAARVDDRNLKAINPAAKLPNTFKKKIPMSAPASRNDNNVEKLAATGLKANENGSTEKKSRKDRRRTFFAERLLPKPVASIELAESSESKSYVKETTCELPVPSLTSSTIAPEKASMSKQEISNQKRVEALRSQQEATMAQQNAIKQALAVSNVAGNRRVVFESSGSDTSDSEVTSRLGADESNKAEIEQRPVLFGDDESSNDSDDEHRLRLRPQYEGEKGAKPMNSIDSAPRSRSPENLRMRREMKTNDSRFKLDERFESDDEDDDTRMSVANSVVDKDARCDGHVTEEKRRSLAILSSIVGEKAVTKRRIVYEFKPLSRYDPTAPDHEKFEVKTAEPPVRNQNKKLTDKNSPDNDTHLAHPADTPVPTVSSERFAETDPSLLAEVFQAAEGRDKAGGAFSLFGAMERSDSEGEEGDHDAVRVQTEDVKMASTPRVAPKSIWENFGPGLDSDGEEEKEGFSNVLKSIAAEANTPKSFFLHDNDSRLVAGVEFFRRKASMDEIREEWLRKRPSRVEFYRQRRKAVVRRIKNVRHGVPSTTKNSFKTATTKRKKSA